MRAPRLRPAPIALALAFLLAALNPAAAQVKADLGAGAADAALGAVSPSVLSAGPMADLAPAARPDAAGLPASALVAAPAAAAPLASEAPREAPRASAAEAVASPSASGSAAAETPNSRPSFFIKALQNLGVPADLTTRLTEFLATRHPGDQDAIDHGLGHSREVADYTARVVQNANLPAARKILLIFSASLHDVDPERVPDTPARVAATIKYLEENPAASALIGEFSSRYGFTPAQVGALILATDFSPDRAEMKARQQTFAQAAAAAFPGEDFGLVWGRRLAFVDQSSTYLGDVESAKKRVEGLAAPGQFLHILRGDPSFDVLPADLQKRFEAIEAYFSARRTPDAWAAPAAPVPARAPPDAEAARRYVRSIAAGIKLDERQTDGLLEQFFQEHGIAPLSERADAVRRELIPSKVAAEDKAVASLSPSLRRHRGVLLKLAAERKTTPAAIEAVLARRGILQTIAGLGEAEFERQAEFTLERDELERAVAGYPRNEQGELMRSIAGHMSTASGKSVEEVARDGVFAYVDFAGAAVRRASAGRDPDVRAFQVVFYVTRRGSRWRIDGYRQNRETGRRDAELKKNLMAWLTAGGVPAMDLE